MFRTPAPSDRRKTRCGKKAYVRPPAPSNRTTEAEWRSILENARQPVMHEAAELINQALQNSPTGICDYCVTFHNLKVSQSCQIDGLLCGSCRIRISKNYLCQSCGEWPLTIDALGRPMRNICSKCIGKTQQAEICNCGKKKWVNPCTGAVAALCKTCHRSSIQKAA